MKLGSLRVIKWYSATLGVAAGAVVYAYLGIGPVLPGALVFGTACYCSLAALRHTEEEFNPYQKLSEGIAAVGMVAFLPLIFLTDFLVALVVFIGFAQLALNFQTHDYRRFYVGVVVSFIGICVGATESKSGFYLVFFLIYTILASITIGYAYMAQRQDVETPQWGWTDRMRVSLLMIGVAVGIYLILPRFPAGGLLSQPGSGHFYHDKTWEAEARQNDKINPRDQIDELREDQLNDQNSRSIEDFIRENAAGDSDNGDDKASGDYDYKGFRNEFNINNPDEKGHRYSNRIVARMRADHPQYLRARIFDLFDGLRWRVSSDQVVKLRVDYDGVDLISPDQYTSSELQSYEVFIEHNIGDYIPAAAVPVQLKFPATAIGIDIFGQIRSPGALKKGTAYALTSQYNFLRGRRFAELDHTPLPSYTQLPDEMDPRIGELAGSVVKEAHTQLAGAIALEHHFRTQYRYDFGSVFSSQNATPLGEFLFESKSGHCEYFASALAIMLRTQNIPSRLVTGFSATNRNPLTGYFDIYALDGHAWVEAFVDDQGWVILEPTAYYDGPLPDEEKVSVRQINDYVERQIRLRDALGRDELTIAATINAAWHLLYVVVSAGLVYVNLFIMNSWYWLVAALIAGVGSWVAWRQYGHLWQAYCIYRRVTSYTADQPRKAVYFYLSATEELLRLAGFNHPPGHTIERYLENIESIEGAHADPTLAGAFNRIYYNSEEGDPVAMQHYKRLFQSLYNLGLRNLQSMAKAGRQE